MRYSVAALVLFTVVASGCSGDGEKKPENKKDQPAPVASSSSSSSTPPAETPKAAARDLPFNPYARVASGDWYCALVRAKYEGKAPKDALPAASVWCWTGSAETDADKAVIAFETKPAIADLAAGSRTWSNKEAPRGEDFLGGFKPEEITDWKCEDEKKTVGDKEFDCKKISAAIGTDTITVWLCADIPVTGIVAMTRKSDLGGGSAEVLEFEVAGFKATEPQASWGKTAEELEKSLAEGK